MPDPGLDPDFDPESMLRALSRHGVRWILVGGYAAVLHGSPYITSDLDVVPDPDPENLGKLSAALEEMHARIWTDGEPEGVPFEHDAVSLAAVRVWNLITDFGRLDLTFEPTGTSGYPDLSRDAVQLSIQGSDVVVASLADVIRSKEAADRPKDRFALPVLRRILDEN